MWRIVLIYCLLLALLPPGIARGDDHLWTAFTQKRLEYVEELSESVFYCIQRHDSPYPVFHGCFDWHSSVHGYWALLKAAQFIKGTTGQRYINYVIQTFSSDALNQENAYLRHRKSFEMPYGRAWFLILAIEYEKITALTTLRPMADEVALSMVEYYKLHAPTPNLPEYSNAEWAIRSLHDYGNMRQNVQIIEFIDSLTSVFLVSASSQSLRFDYERADFFSRLANYFHLLEVTVNADTFVNALEDADLNTTVMHPVQPLRSDHHLGINYSRAWGFWSMYKITKDKRYLDAYMNHAIAGFQLHAMHKNDYMGYGHWVPQFGIYALTYSME